MVTGHAENENAAKLSLTQKKDVADILKRPPSESVITANFWDIPALHDVVEAKFRVTYESDATYRLLMHFAGMSFKLPDAYDKRRDEAAITARMAKIRTQVAKLLKGGYEVYTLDEVRVEHESETRRIWLPRGERTKLYVDRKRAAQSFFGALSLTTKRMKIYPIDGKQNAEAIILAMTRLQRETTADKIAVVLDNAGHDPRPGAAQQRHGSVDLGGMETEPAVPGGDGVIELRRHLEMQRSIFVDAA
ncbi:MAG: transposase [Acidipropionibacterium sp.]|nr:transposase [Acidipropionibacterium sp.]